VEVVANAGSLEDARRALAFGAEGIGLLRTEFLFLNRSLPPDEGTQFSAYRSILELMGSRPVVVRTLDIGGDKEVPYYNFGPEANPFLGYRAIRISLERPEEFKTQLGALLRAGVGHDLRIMFPMIATLEDLAAARALAEEVRLETGADPVEIGIMIEVPSAVIMAEEFAKEVDFFSIGTNDLTQYVLAVDRLHPLLAGTADGLHPAVLRMVDATVRAASAAGKWVGVCGGIAGDPRGALILMGLGVSELSVSVPSVAAVKAKIRQSSLSAAQAMAKRALACRNAAEVRSLSFQF
jgi:phosphocarrier protein FPr